MGPLRDLVPCRVNRSLCPHDTSVLPGGPWFDSERGTVGAFCLSLPVHLMQEWCTTLRGQPVQEHGEVQPRETGIFTKRPVSTDPTT